MPFAAVNPISASSLLWWTGESTTGNGGMPLQVLALIHGLQARAARPSTPSSNARSAPGPVAQTGNIGPAVYQPFTYCTPSMFNGYAGQGVNYWNTNLSTIVTSLNGAKPTHIFSWLGVNDNGSFDQSAYTTATTTLVNGFRSSFPLAQVILISQLCNGEKWDNTSGSAWGPNAQDANIVLQENAKQSVCTSFGLPYIDLRTPLLAWEVVNNASPIVVHTVGNNAALTTDGIHPAIANGQAIVAPWVYSALTVS